MDILLLFLKGTKNALATRSVQNPTTTHPESDGCDRPGIGLYERIMGQQQKPLYCRLGHEDAIKGIPMDIRKLPDRNGMLTGDR